jgi:hypothetical protein
LAGDVGIELEAHCPRSLEAEPESSASIRSYTR